MVVLMSTLPRMRHDPYLPGIHHTWSSILSHFKPLKWFAMPFSQIAHGLNRGLCSRTVLGEWIYPFLLIVGCIWPTNKLVGHSNLSGSFNCFPTL